MTPTTTTVHSTEAVQSAQPTHTHTHTHASGFAVDTSHSPLSRLRPVPFTHVQFEDTFWAPRLEQVKCVTLPQQYEQLERDGRLNNFRRAAGHTVPPYDGPIYGDGPVHKWLEAASYAFATPGGSTAALHALFDEVRDAVLGAQTPDGYLNTKFSGDQAAQRWTQLGAGRSHEFFLAGHFIQAGIAHHRSTGETSLLDAAIRFADLICATFGADRKRATDHHPGVEMALVELYRETGNRQYLDQALYFLDERGHTPPLATGDPRHQDHLPVREQHEIVGHAVCATYLTTGMADVVLETGEASLDSAQRALWDSAFGRKAYVTGALGAHWSGEAFGAEYELPNERAYAETCAAIGGFYWNWRLFESHR